MTPWKVHYSLQPGEKSRKEKEVVVAIEKKEALVERFRKRQENCGHHSNRCSVVNQCTSCLTGFAYHLLCGLFFLCNYCAEHVVSFRWKRIFRSVLEYAAYFQLRVLFVTLTQYPFEVAAEGVKTTNKRFSAFMKKRITKIDEEAFERELAFYRLELEANGYSESKINEKLSRQKWAWRWWKLYIRFFNGDSSALEKFRAETKSDLEFFHCNNILRTVEREVKKANKALKDWGCIRRVHESVVREEVVNAGKSKDQVEEIVRRKVRDKFCKVSGWIDAGAKRVEVKKSQDDKFYFHIHILASVLVPMPKIVLSMLWKSVTEDCGVVDIREIKVDCDGGGIASYASKICEYSSKIGGGEFSQEQKEELQVAFYRIPMVVRIGWDRKKLKDFEEEESEKECSCCGCVGTLKFVGVIWKVSFKGVTQEPGVLFPGAKVVTYDYCNYIQMEWRVVGLGKGKAFFELEEIEEVEEQSYFDKHGVTLSELEGESYRYGLETCY